ncbi:MAG: hypothetical protein DI551_06675 [Micavibrio aeruginosavorus]|uniref:Uncharacterized protein n=1 Tax=Micavibrio aeruginosavorus TaxID=349221 RepID=A0A2W5MZ93_9BACT|nr:MAG: hypothetical protein DI551_06675 [Micavibrio aeruginosavorus]
MKGPEYSLPPSLTYVDAHGVERDHSRIRWWAEREDGLGALIDRPEISDDRFKKKHENGIMRLRERFAYASEKPLFVGHYYMSGPPRLIGGANAACLDFKNHVVAYRWNEGDKGFSSDRLVYV